MIQKSKILTLIVFAILFLNLSAQEDRKFRFGIRFDPNISWMSPNTTSFKSEGSKIGFNFGLSTEFFLSENYLFSTGFFIASTGGNLSYQGVFLDNNGVYNPTRVDQSYSIKSVEVPLTLKLRTNEIGYFTYYGQFGAKLGFKYKSTSDYTYDVNSLKEEGVNTAGDIFFMNAFLVIGGGFEFNLSGNTNVMVGVTYNNGFINQLDRKYNELDATTGNAKLDPVTLKPVMSSKDASANLNYFALNIGVYF